MIAALVTLFLVFVVYVASLIVVLWCDQPRREPPPRRIVLPREPDTSVERKMLLQMWINGGAFFLHPEGPLSDKTVNEWCREKIDARIKDLSGPTPDEIEAIYGAAAARGELH